MVGGGAPQVAVPDKRKLEDLEPISGDLKVGQDTLAEKVISGEGNVDAGVSKVNVDAGVSKVERPHLEEGDSGSVPLLKAIVQLDPNDQGQDLEMAEDTPEVAVSGKRKLEEPPELTESLSGDLGVGHNDTIAENIINRDVDPPSEAKRPRLGEGDCGSSCSVSLPKATVQPDLNHQGQGQLANALFSCLRNISNKAPPPLSNREAAAILLGRGPTISRSEFNVPAYTVRIPQADGSVVEHVQMKRKTDEEPFNYVIPDYRQENIEVKNFNEDHFFYPRVRRCVDVALQEYAKTTGLIYEFVEVEKVIYYTAAGFVFYIAFNAMSPQKELTLLEAEVFDAIGGKQYVWRVDIKKPGFKWFDGRLFVPPPLPPNKVFGYHTDD